jgi:colicin import membrane protein
LALKWLAYKDFVVAIDKNGIQATTFTEADFKLTGCNAQIAEAQLVARQSAIIDEEELEVEGPNEDAKAAADNAKKAA